MCLYMKLCCTLYKNRKVRYRMLRKHEYLNFKTMMDPCVHLEKALFIEYYFFRELKMHFLIGTFKKIILKYFIELNIFKFVL